MLLVIPIAYGAYAYSRFDSGITRVDAIPHASASASAVPVSSAAEQNILLVGDDHRPAGASEALLQQLGTQEDGGGTNTDTMIILHIAAGGRAASLISLPRDSYVNIPGHGMDKLNAAFAIGQATGGDAGGAQLLITTVQQITGLTISHFVRVSLVGFYEIVKELGPVTVCLNHAVDDPYSGVDLPAGTSTLDPAQALAFVRQRHGLTGGDLDREARQQYFLTVEAKRMASAGVLLNPIRLSGLIDTVSSSIETDSGFNLLTLATQLQHLNPTAIRSGTLPVAGTPTIQVGGEPLSIVQLDTTAIPTFIASMTASSAAGTPSHTPGTTGASSSTAAPTRSRAPASTQGTNPGQPTPTATPTPAAGTAYADVPCIN
ncbi:LCP family protein [Curtobacterium sp. 22159]|uniref:LCP family protein n=1 Tax=Curtobacterium sp. 22159 TaxID=3453882 RepID=UPI003F868C0B